MKTRDWALLLCLLLISAGVTLALNRTTVPATTASIGVSGREIQALPLDRDQTYGAEGALGGFEVEVAGGGVRMLRSTCPDQLCVGQGAIARSGQSIVCLPNQVSITLSGERRQDGLDAVAY